jgi:DNA primase catalytic subunit
MNPQIKKEIPFRPSALKERKDFYENEFSIQDVKNWFKKNKIPLPQLCAIDAGTESKIILNKKLNKALFYFPFKNLKEKIKKYSPEDIYYDKNIYKNPKETLDLLNFNDWKAQELVFDLDADNLKCNCKNKEKPCNQCLNDLYLYSISLKKLLKKEGFSKIFLVYSGRGFHIHVLDKKAYLFTIKQRKALTKKISNFPLDPWVSQGNINLIRLPYSLHGLVSRKCLPLKNNKFNLDKTIPNFLKTE